MEDYYSDEDDTDDDNEDYDNDTGVERQNLITHILTLTIMTMLIDIIEKRYCQYYNSIILRHFFAVTFSYWKPISIFFYPN